MTFFDWKMMQYRFAVVYARRHSMEVVDAILYLRPFFNAQYEHLRPA